MAMITRATTGGSVRWRTRSGPRPYGRSRSRCGARTRCPRHAGVPVRGGARACQPQRHPGATHRAASRISSWSDSNPPKTRLATRATTSMRSPSWTGPRYRAAERDTVEDVAVPLQRQRSVVVPGDANASDGQPEDRDERLGIAGTVRRQHGELAMQADSRHLGPAEPCRSEHGRDPRDGGRSDRLEPLYERRPALGRDLEAGRTSVAAVTDERVGAVPRAAPRSTDPSLRQDARIVSRGPRQRRPDGARSSARRAATSPTMPTGHGPWTIGAPARSGARAGERTRLRHRRLGQVAARLVGGLEGSACVAASAASASSSRAASRASPTRPAAFKRGARRTRACRGRRRPARPRRARAGLRTGRGSRAHRSSPSRAMARFSPTIGPRRRPADRREIGQLESRLRSTRQPARSSWATLKATPLPASRASG